MVILLIVPCDAPFRVLFADELAKYQKSHATTQQRNEYKKINFFIRCVFASLRAFLKPHHKMLLLFKLLPEHHDANKKKIDRTAD